MSYYCKGKICPRAKECARVKAWEIFPKKDVEEGFATGVWFVPERICMNNDYEDGVFHDPKEENPFIRHASRLYLTDYDQRRKATGNGVAHEDVR